MPSPWYAPQLEGSSRPCCPSSLAPPPLRLLILHGVTARPEPRSTAVPPLQTMRFQVLLLAHNRAPTVTPPFSLPTCTAAHAQYRCTLSLSANRTSRHLLLPDHGLFRCSLFLLHGSREDARSGFVVSNAAPLGLLPPLTLQPGAQTLAVGIWLLLFLQAAAICAHGGRSSWPNADRRCCCSPPQAARRRAAGVFAACLLAGEPCFKLQYVSRRVRPWYPLHSVAGASDHAVRCSCRDAGPAMPCDGDQAGVKSDMRYKRRALPR